ncbi:MULTISPECIES: alpha/beta hydrolase [unclassified Phenylobacterium]|uniref:alpha/beta hydrolase n=1 Tax=unclassified Phenylobacterium TaxID=2640670 RepID=UPI00083A8D54|nr:MULTISPECIES: alpha/beta hydrolase [unclassified Phenylobacterium]
MSVAAATLTPAVAAHAQPLRDCRAGLQLMPANRALIDPELLSTLATMGGGGGGERTAANMPAVRANFLEGFKRRAALAPPAPAGVRMEERHIPGPAGAPPVRVLIYSPDGPPATRPALLDIHGGSYILGFPEMNDARNRMLVKALGAVIVSIDYRLAPENPFPAAIDDSWAAFEWLHANATALGVDPARIAVSGDSAGGGLAASLALMARDKGKLPLRAQILIYPNVDDRPFTALDPTCQPGTGAATSRLSLMYLGRPGGADDVPAYAFAARAKSLAGVAPAFIAVGAVDGLADQDLAYAQRLIQAGTPTEVHVYPGAFHGFDYATKARVTQQFHGDLIEALRKIWR